MRQNRRLRSKIAFIGAMAVTLTIVGCQPPLALITPAPTPTPAAPIASAAASSYQPYYPGKNYLFVLCSSTFATGEAITNITTTDNMGNPVTAWTQTASTNYPVVVPGSTFTILLTAPSSAKVNQPVLVAPGKERPAPPPAGGPTGSGTITVTTTTTTISIPVIQIGTDPCAAN